MQNHHKQYEDLFTIDCKGNLTPLGMEKVSIEGMNFNQYISLFGNLLNEFYSDLFLNCVKIAWLRRKFKYKGKKIKFPIYNNSLYIQSVFVKLLRRFVGHDIQILTKGPFYSKLESHYFDKLFPGFEEGNPFTNPDYYKLPYKNITLEYLTVVYQLDDRFDLLKEADEKKMSFSTFLDYVLNYTFCENERLGFERYRLYQDIGRVRPYFVKDFTKNFTAKKGKKRQ